MPGSQMSSSTTSTGLRPQRGEALLAALGEQRLVALILQHALQRAADFRLVIHDQNGVHVVPKVRPSGHCCATGNSTIKRVPTGEFSSTRIEP